MIILIIKSKDHETMIQKREEFHRALIGTPAYKRSEIVICETEGDKTSFMLIIGNGGNDSITRIIDSDNLIDSILPVGINNKTLS
jgi:hypothetical protein